MKKLFVFVLVLAQPLMADFVSFGENSQRVMNVDDQDVTLEEVIHVVLQLENESFADAIKHGVVVVDFYADWCGPCRRFAPKFAKVAEELQEYATFAKLNISTSSLIANLHHIKTIPTVIIFRNGKESKRHTGSLSEEALKNFVLSAVGD